MTRYGQQFGPDFTFLGVPGATSTTRESYADADVVILGAPVRRRHLAPAGRAVRAEAIRMTDYLPHDGSRPSLALRTDGLRRPRRRRRRRRRDVLRRHRGRPAGAARRRSRRWPAPGAIPVILGGDHSIAFPDAKGVANVLGHGRVSMIHFDAHADTGDIEFGSLWGHGQPMRRLIESGALRGDRFLQVGLRGYWPPPETLDWMAGAADAVLRDDRDRATAASTTCLTEAFAIATDECDGVFLSVDIDVCDPGHAPGTGTPEPGGLTARQLLDAVRRICLELPVVGIDVVEVSPPYDHADITAALANRVVLEALSAIARRRRDAATAPAGPVPAPAGRPGLRTTAAAHPRRCRCNA